MVDSEDITLEKLKTQAISFEINTLSDTCNQITSITDKPSETLQIQAVNPNNKSKPQFEKYCYFRHKNIRSVSTCCRRINRLKESRPQSKSPTPSFYQLFKTHLPIRMTIKLPVTAVVAIVTTIKNSHENLAINPVLNPVQILAQDTIIITLLRTIPHIMIVIDPDMINITKTRHVHFSLLAPVIFQTHLVVLINLTLVLTNAPLVIIIPRFYALLLNHVLIAFNDDLTLTKATVQIPITNLLSILLNNQFLIFIILPQKNLNLE